MVSRNLRSIAQNNSISPVWRLQCRVPVFGIEVVSAWGAQRYRRDGTQCVPLMRMQWRVPNLGQPAEARPFQKVHDYERWSQY
jgi:hypothetical protein